MHRHTPLCEHTHLATSCSPTPLLLLSSQPLFLHDPLTALWWGSKETLEETGFHRAEQVGHTWETVGVLLDTHVCFQMHLHMQQHAAPRPCALRHTHRSSCVAAHVKASAGMHAHQVTCCSELQAWSGHPTPSGPLPSRVPFGFEMELAKRTSVQAGFPQTFRLAPSQP